MWKAGDGIQVDSAIFLLFLALSGVTGLKDVTVTIPIAVAAGDTVSLNCDYDLEKDELYSFKWYKNKHEFFRYIPKELPHTKVFPLPGVDVDMNRSGPKTLVLRSVQPSITDKYRCEVIAEAPTYRTLMKSGYMYVIDLPDTAPEIVAEGSVSEKMKVSIGDTVKFRCSAPPSHPPANITWFLNNSPINGSPLEYDPPMSTNSSKKQDVPQNSVKLINRNGTTLFGKPSIGTRENNYGFNGLRDQSSFEKSQTSHMQVEPRRSYQTDERIRVKVDSFEYKASTEKPTGIKEIVKRKSSSTFTLTVQEEHFRQGKLAVICKATLFTLYKAEARLTVEGERPQIASVLGTRDSSSDAGSVFKYTCISILISITSMVIGTW